MSGVENMRRILSESGAYQLTGDTPVDQELDAYGAGLETVEEQARRLEEDMFALTASPEILKMWELLYRRQASWADPDVRRNGVAKALSRRGAPVLAGDAPGLLEAAGIKGTVREQDGKLVIQVEEYQGITETEARRLLGRLLPAHLEWEIEASDDGD